MVKPLYQLKYQLKSNISSNPISAQFLSEKAKYFKQYLDLKVELKNPFEASTGFIRRFCIRNGIQLRNCHGENFTSNKIEAQLFIRKIHEIVETEKYSGEQLFNMDEAGLIRKSLPKKSLTHKNDICPSSKIFKILVKFKF